MPRTAIDYTKIVIYKIVCKDLEVKYCYVGSTTDFTRRKYEHKRLSKAEKSTLKLYKLINENKGWDNFDMVVIENYPCKNSNEAFARERYWYDLLNANMNTNKPLITDNEKEQYMKDYKATNRVKLLSYLKDYLKKYQSTDTFKEYDRNRKNRDYRYHKESERLRNILIQ